MTPEELRGKLQRLLQDSEEMDPATVLEILEEAAEPLRGTMCILRMDKEAEELKKRYKKDAIVG